MEKVEEPTFDSTAYRQLEEDAMLRSRMNLISMAKALNLPEKSSSAPMLRAMHVGMGLHGARGRHGSECARGDAAVPVQHPRGGVPPPDDFAFLADTRIAIPEVPAGDELHVDRCVLPARSPFLRGVFTPRTAMESTWKDGPRWLVVDLVGRLGGRDQLIRGYMA
ncbi:hypothetical protein E2562_034707 [Oryza meyeriana var. granulata]|uniref:Uncharacterized protein n=1 Tax=Oryza meyeriana var. granulata TaxID=110450 RepID=A0A6G1C9R2_9ORYZ|nr:hypothetical protein E2562_034707 [Oryza meyeriana var. granulata]